MVTVAQLVESRIVIPVVVGSSPIGHPKNLNGFRAICRNPFCFSGAVGILRCITRGDDLHLAGCAARFALAANPTY